MKSSLVRIRHARSKKDFPFLSLEEGEYVELAVYRSKAGLILIWATVLAAIVLLGIAGATVIGSITRSNNVPASTMGYFWLLLGILYVFLILMGLGLSKVYTDNKIFITNRKSSSRKLEFLLHVSFSLTCVTETDPSVSPFDSGIPA